MPPTCPKGNPTCRWYPQPQRHDHAAPLLNELGEKCWCGALDWRIIFGGLLPARVQCAACNAGFNIAQRLRDCGNPRNLLGGTVQQ